MTPTRDHPQRIHNSISVLLFVSSITYDIAETLQIIVVNARVCVCVCVRACVRVCVCVCVCGLKPYIFTNYNTNSSLCMYIQLSYVVCRFYCIHPPGNPYCPFLILNAYFSYAERTERKVLFCRR